MRMRVNTASMQWTTNNFRYCVTNQMQDQDPSDFLTGKELKKKPLVTDSLWKMYNSCTLE
jgi:hypothetical protein